LHASRISGSTGGRGTVDDVDVGEVVGAGASVAVDDDWEVVAAGSVVATSDCDEPHEATIVAATRQMRRVAAGRRMSS